MLQPLRAGRSASFLRYDWVRRAMDGVMSIKPAGVIVVEGVYLLRERLRPYWDLSVFVEAPPSLRLARADARGLREEGWLAQWRRAEEYYAVAENPAAAADLVVAGF